MKLHKTAFFIALISFFIAEVSCAEEKKHAENSYVAMIISPIENGLFWASLLKKEALVLVPNKASEEQKKEFFFGRDSPPVKNFNARFYGLKVRCCFDVGKDGELDITGYIETSAPRNNIWEDWKNNLEKIKFDDMARMAIEHQFYYNCKKFKKVTLKLTSPKIGHGEEEIELSLAFHTFDKYTDYKDFVTAWRKTHTQHK